MAESYDLIIIGGGFGGSLMGIIAAKLGHRVVIVERGVHPRFAIGESSTPLANLILEELAIEFDLRRILPLTKWGSWQTHYPELPVGLKRGFTFYHHAWDLPADLNEESSSALLVAASPNDALADTHWHRPSFDHFLIREALAAGVVYWDATELESFDQHACGVRVHGRRDGHRVELSAPWMVDATGPHGFIAQKLGLEATPNEFLSRNEGLFAHFKGVRPFEACAGKIPEAPYPPDAAATHHLFPGGWIWVLPFNHGVTSAGVSANSALAENLCLKDGQAGWERLLRRLPSVEAQFSEAQLVEPFRYSSKLSYRCARNVGKRWAMLPSTAGFADPLLSTGFALTLLGIQRLARLLSGGDCPTDSALTEYGESISRDLAAAELLVGTLIHHLGDPPMFNSLVMIYFAAVSYAESARRLGRPQLAPGFLLHGREEFWNPARTLLLESRVARMALSEVQHRVREAIDSINIGGWMTMPERRCHPVDFMALIQAASKLASDPVEVQGLLDRMKMGLPKLL